jgi:DNA-directed RNA polymerase alpha subunit
MGSAVTQIKIRGAQHEFTSIPGVVEDVTQIVLNVKSLVVRNHSEATRVITIEANKAGVITGGDIQTDSDVEIINKDHVIATLTEDVDLMIEMVVENGRGCHLAAHEAHALAVLEVDGGVENHEKHSVGRCARLPRGPRDCKDPRLCDLPAR